jgi:hypothetical protein
MSNCENLTITPINKSEKSKSNIDYAEQLERTATGDLNWCWDDSKYNKAQPGQYFAFMFYGKKVIIHKILSVKPPSERLPSWSSNVGQGDRNVVELSGPLKELTWEEWLANDGPQAHLGTYTAKNNLMTRKRLYDVLYQLNQNTDGYIQTLERENLRLKNELKILKSMYK